MVLPRTCIIGAGSSGIAAAKALHARGLPFDCYEASDRVGGNWVLGNKNGMSACYRGLFINTSKTRMAYSDFPMPESYPDFPHHAQIAEYFERYVDRFGFRSAIRFETPVTRVERRTDGRFDVVVGAGEAKVYDAIAVANGHHWDPRWPEPAFPGHFDGVQMHAHAYLEADAWKDLRVLVLGMGNSAMDIAVEASYVAKKTMLCSRRGAWIAPKYLFGRPSDTVVTDARIPFRIRRRIAEELINATVGDLRRFGLPAPDHRFGSAHPTISGRILDRMGHGAIVYRPNIERLEGKQVRFVDGTVEDVDVIVYCTGYKVTFPFFDPSFVSAPENDLALFRRVFHPSCSNLFFVGLLQPLGAIMPLAEAQSSWIAEYLLGEYALPPERELIRDIEHDRRAMFERYVASPRHTMQVDYDDYLLAMERERGRGRKRARARGPGRVAAPRA